MPFTFARWLLMLALAACVADAKNSSQSYSTINISEMTGEESGALDYFPEIAVSGNAVHVIWFADEGNPVVRVLYYRRSLDGGKTWERRQRLLADERLNTGGLSRRLAADGSNVYVFASASRLLSVQGRQAALILLRSTNNGQSWEAPHPLEGSATLVNTGEIFVTARGGTVGLAFHYTSTALQWVLVALHSPDGGRTFQMGAIFNSANFRGSNLWDVYESNGVYFLMHASFYANSLNSTLYVSSWRPGQAAYQATVSVPADDGLHKANILQNQNYVPKFGGDAGNLWIIFHGYEGANVRGIFVRRSGDSGRTWSTPMNLIRNDPNATRYAFGLETVGAGTQGAYAVIVNNSGAAFVHWLHIARTQQITTAASPTNGCWWPQVLIDNKKTRNVYVYCRLPMVATSTDGNSFAPPVPLGPFNSWQLTATQGYHGHAVLSDDGALHWVIDGVTTFYRTGQFGDRDIFYRRYEPAPVAGTRDQALKTTSLKNAGDGSGAESWDSMVVPASEALSPTKAFTLTAWVRPMPGGPDTGTTGQLRPMIHRSGDRIGDPLFGIGSTGPDGARRPYAQIRTTRQSYFIEPPAWRSFLPETQMIHLALTFEADAGPNNVKLYMDGALVAQGTAQGEIAAGSGLMVFGYYGAWEIDDVRLWHRTLNGDEVRNMRQGPASREDGTLRAWWTLNDTTRDAIGANHGVLNYRESYADSGAPSAAVLKVGGTTNAASGASGIVTADSLATFYGAGISDSNYEATTVPLPNVLGQVRGWVRHRSGSPPMQMVFVSPNQVNLLVPPGLPAGDGEVVIECPRGIIGQPVTIAAVEPGLFLVGAQRVAAGYGVRYGADASQTVMMAFDGELNPAPMDLGGDQDQVWLTLFGTGFRAESAPRATVGAVTVPAVAAAQGNFAGLDQVNIGPLPRTLAGAGTIDVFIEAGGRRSNAVRVAIR